MCYWLAGVQACRDFLDVAETHSRRWQRALQYEREQRHHLEETIEQLAKQHNSLERAWREAPSEHTGQTRISRTRTSWTHKFLCLTRVPSFLPLTHAHTHL